jgi:putative ABC transport system substrate-binding protein
MRRREFIAGVALVSAWPVLAAAQRAKVPVIGFLGPTTAAVATTRIAAFVERLRGLGWTDGVNLNISYLWADGRTDRFAEMAGELVRLKSDVIVTWGTETAIAVKQATPSIPIVFTIVGDPVGSGLVASLSRPGGNVTGLSTQHADSAGKRIELLREIVPSCRSLAIIVNVLNPGSLQERKEVEAAADRLGIDVTTLEIRRPEDIDPAFAAMKGGIQALFVSSDALLNANRARINGLALKRKLPTVYGFRDGVMVDGLLSYGPNYEDLFRRAADYADKVLRGTPPSDIPVEQPTKFELVVNLKTAKALGLEVPATLVIRADEVIE